MNILVTGAAGYIASELIPLLAREHKIDGMDILQPYGHVAAHCNWIFGSIHNLPIGQLRDYDTVIHMAATFSENEAAAYEVNVLATMKLLGLAMGNGANFIFISTCGVLKEADQSVYTKTKRQAEAEITPVYRKVQIVRLASVYGLAKPMNYKGLVNNLVQSAVEKRCIEIRGANEYRPIIHVYDAVKQIIETMENGVSAVNAVTENVTKQQIADIIQKYYPNDMHVDISNSDKPGYRIEPTLKPTIGLEHGIREMIEELTNATVL